MMRNIVDIAANKCTICRGDFYTTADPNGMHHGEGICSKPPAPMKLDQAMGIMALAVLDIQREQRRQERETRRHIDFIYYALREMGAHPDTIHATLTTGDRPLNVNDQAIASVVLSSSKTGKNFPFDPADIQYSIDKSAVATVTPLGDGTANVTAVSEGSATITATYSSNGSTLTGVFALTVTAVAVPDAPDTLTVLLTPIVPGAVAVSGAKPVS